MQYLSSKIVGDSDVERVIVGDFNCPQIYWLSGSVVGPSESVNRSIVFQKQFLDQVHNAGLDWLITDEVTRRRKVGSSIQESTLDQIFVSEESLISEFNIKGPLGKSDHVSMILDLNVAPPKKSHCNDIDDVKRNWSKCSL